jgi:hypothetical protein
MIKRVFVFMLVGAVAASVNIAVAWDYEGHRIVNQLALASLPTNFPGFTRTAAARERIAWLSGEPDRWRNAPDELPLTHDNGPDHYLDLESLKRYNLTPETLPIFRYDFVANLATTRGSRPEKFSADRSARDRDHTRDLIGFLPWAIVEYSGKLKSGFATLKALEENGGTADEIANAQQDIIYVMGVMGHFVGDGSQPLHTTIHHHGWVGANPRGYTRDRSFHQWIDGDYFRKTGGLKLETMCAKIQPAQLTGRNSAALFTEVMGYLMETHRQVEPLYQLQKAGGLSGEGEKGLEGKTFLEDRLVSGGQMLGNIWYSAWQQAPDDRYLRDELQKRSHDAGAVKPQ